MTRFTPQNPPVGFYTYAYLRKDGRPFYIGKGQNGRAWARHGSIKKPWQPPSEDRILILKQDLTEDQAHRHEVYLIDVLGNHYADNGLLTLNFTDGGEGTSGYQYTDELREIRRTQLKGNNYGANAVWTQERRQALSLATTGVKKTLTPAVLARHENLNIRYHWEHSELGRRYASAQEMSKLTGFSQAHFWRAKEGHASQAHGWICLDPVKPFAPKEKNVQLAVNKAAAAKNKRGAEELGITVEEYKAMSYSKRYRARKASRLAA